MKAAVATSVFLEASGRSAPSKLDSGTRLEANPVPPEEAVSRHQDGCWRPELVKQNIRWHRGGSRYKRVGSEEASLWRPSRSPPCSPPLATQ